MDNLIFFFFHSDTKSKNYVSSASDGETTEAPSHSVGINSVRGEWKKLRSYMMLRNKDGEGGPKISYNETSDLYLM